MSAVVEKAQNLRIFRPVDEAIHLVLPILFIVLIVAELYLGQRFFSVGFIFESFIVDIVLLNVTHNAFTYGMLMSLPELSPWIKNRGGGSAKKFWLKMCGINLVLAVGFFFLFFYGGNDSYLKVLFYVITVFFPVHHALSQSFGLSLIYNKKAGLPVKEFEQKERSLSRIFLMLVLVGVLFVTLLIGKFIYLENALTQHLWLAVRILVFASATGLIAAMFFYPKKMWWAKSVFSLRYLVWAFSIFSPVAIAGTKVIHGIEYAFVTRKMMTNSKSNRSTWLKIGFVLIFTVIALAYFRFVALQSYAQSKELPIWFYILAAVSFALTFSHYYLDRGLFQMRHKMNRETAGVLLVEN